MNQELKHSGMTLVEVLVAIAISGVILAGLFSLFATHNKIAAKQEETTLMQQELLAATTQIADSLRMCGYAPTGGTGAGFAHLPDISAPDFGRGTNQTAVYCTLDWNGDGLINENGTGSSFDHAGFRLNVNNNGSPKAVPDNVLRKYDTGAVHWQPANTNIADLRFTYFDEHGALIGNPEAETRRIRSVRISLTAVPSETRKNLGIGNRTMTTTVNCRNISM